MEININALYKVIGEQLKKRRREFKLTQQELAETLGIERTSVTNIESGTQKPPLHLLYQFCYVLNLDLNLLLPTVNEIIVGESDVTREIASLPPKTAES